MTKKQKKKTENWATTHNKVYNPICFLLFIFILVNKTPYSQTLVASRLDNDSK